MYYIKVKPSEVSEVTKLFKRLFKVYMEECEEQKIDKPQDSLNSMKCQVVETENGNGI